MTAWIRSWTPKIEFTVVSMIAFVLPVTGSALYFFSRTQGSIFSDYGLRYTLLFETVSLIIIGFILYVRQLDLRRFGLNPSLILTAQGLLLYVVAVLTSGIVEKIVALMLPDMGAQLSPLSHGNLNVLTKLAISIVNPFFEEILLVGYVITSLEKLTTTTQAVLVSVTLRVACHLYQGPTGIAYFMAMGFIFAYFFIRKRQLWPLIIAHSIWDFLGLMALTRV